MQVFLLLSVGLFLLVAVAVYLVMQPMLIRAPRVVADVDVSAAQLRDDTEYLVKSFVPRDAFYPDNLRAMARYLEERFTRAGARVALQRYEADGREYYNVIASYGPEQDPRLVIGAHYDTCCQLPGADDNTSGVAGLLALAPLLAKTKLQRRVDLVSFTLEDPPFFRTDGMGSAQHAKMLAEQKVEIDLMISLEMIGYFTDAPDTQDYPLSVLKFLYPTTGNFLAVVGRTGEGAIAKKNKIETPGQYALADLFD